MTPLFADIGGVNSLNWLGLDFVSLTITVSSVFAAGIIRGYSILNIPLGPALEKGEDFLKVPVEEI